MHTHTHTLSYTPTNHENIPKHAHSRYSQTPSQTCARSNTHTQAHTYASCVWAFSRQGATGVPLFTTWDSVASSGRAPIPGNISGRSRPRLNTQSSMYWSRDRDLGRLDQGSAGVWEGDYGWGVRFDGYAALLAHAEGVLYGTELGLVTLKRVGLFCFPIKHSTHTAGRRAAGALSLCQAESRNTIHECVCVCVLLLQDLLQSCSRGGEESGGEWRTCAMRDDEPRPVWMSLLITH